MNYTITEWMLGTGITDLMDLVRDVTYPYTYQLGAAALVKVYLTQIYNNPWAASMVVRYEAEQTNFASIYNAAPVLSATDYPYPSLSSGGNMPGNYTPPIPGAAFPG